MDITINIISYRLKKLRDRDELIKVVYNIIRNCIKILEKTGRYPMEQGIHRFNV